MRKLLQALTQMGYRRIALRRLGRRLNGVVRALPERRCRAYMQWMSEHGAFDERHLPHRRANTEESGYRLDPRAPVARPNPPDALDHLQRQHGGRRLSRHPRARACSIPDDIAVASFNDISVAQFLNPPLSTVRLPSEEIGETAVELLLERVAGRELAKRITLAIAARSGAAARGTRAARLSSPRR